jgi:GNAT superfamily N-acetyltransferase
VSAQPDPLAPLAIPAIPSDRRALCDVLARAFWDDPVWAWLFPDEASRHRRLALTFNAYVKDCMRVGTVLTTPDRAGAALWKPPGQWKLSNLAVLRAMPELTRAFGRRMLASLEIERAVEARHPHDPHWYLAVLGTDPPAQGRGVGGVLLREITDRCDRAGLPAYLESSKEMNVPYYQRFGFEVTGDITLGNDGPTIWTMWRDPVAPQD